jgi:ubiquitin-activating enzyme E1
LNILILGLRGVGAEVAKNLVLAGPASVTLHDPIVVTAPDLGCNFFLRDEDVGEARTRAAATVLRLKALNGNTKCSELELAAEQTLEDVARSGRFHAVVATGLPRADAVRLNAACREAGAPFIYSNVYGAAGFAFSDFGPEWHVRSVDGKPRRVFQVEDVVTTGVSADEEQIYKMCGESLPPELVPGLKVTYALRDGISYPNVGEKAVFPPPPSGGGAPQAPGCEFTIRRVTIDRTKQQGTIVIPLPAEAERATVAASGVVYVASRSATLKHAALDAAAGAPKFSNPDAPRQRELHAAFSAVEAWRDSKAGAPLPPLRDAAVAAEVAAAARGLALGGADAVAAAAAGARVAALAEAELPALCAFFGGVVAQEAVKATGVVQPQSQWLYWDAFGVLPACGDPGAPPPEGGAVPQPPSDFAHTGDRYQGITAILGAPLQRAVMDARVFLVGSGALGCEELKNFALMGVGAGPNGLVTVTDMDKIELSNLSRQFLFRADDINKPKSVTAAAAAIEMNPACKIKALTLAVGHETEGEFNDDFWGAQRLVVGALDNIAARAYVDARCAFFGVPLLESGTDGLTFSSTPVLPRETVAWRKLNATGPQKAASIPFCTVKYFPSVPEHCLTWARDQFTGAFDKHVKEAANFAEGSAKWFETLRADNPPERLRKAREVELIVNLAAVGKDPDAHPDALASALVRAAVGMFSQFFDAGIAAVVAANPEDKRDAGGVRFWSSPKRFPRASQLDTSNEAHLRFVEHAAALFGAAVGAPRAKLGDVRAAAAAAFAALPPFTTEGLTANEKGEVVSDDEPAANKAVAALEALCARLGDERLRALAPTLCPLEFEKDDDANHHVDFLTAATNLRATNYSIPTLTRSAVHEKAGNIMAAVATATAAATGLVCIEALKLLAGRGAGALRAAKGNSMTINFFQSVAVDADAQVVSTPGAPAFPAAFSQWWDKLEVNKGGAAELNFAQLGSHFERQGRKAGFPALRLGRIFIGQGEDTTDLCDDCCDPKCAERTISLRERVDWAFAKYPKLAKFAFKGAARLELTGYDHEKQTVCGTLDLRNGAGGPVVSTPRVFCAWKGWAAFTRFDWSAFA